MMKRSTVFTGALSYEFRMQVRRPALWITLTLMSILLVSILSRTLVHYSDVLTHLDQFPILVVVAYWTSLVNRLLPLGIGVLLADRLVRDRRTKVDELLVTLPDTLIQRLLGKYLGTIIATLLPVGIFYLLGIIVIAVLTHNLLAFPLAVETFAAIVLPGVFFIGAFSLAVPVLLWVPLYQFGFIGYWFWGNYLGEGTGIPTLSQTILTPIGKYMEQGFFNDNSWYGFTATPLQAVESILVLLGLAALVLSVLWCLLRWQQANA